MTWSLFKSSFFRWQQDGGTRLGASLAFYTAFSIAPLLLVATAVAGFAFGEEAATGKVLRALAFTMGSKTAQDIQSMIQAAHKPVSGLMATMTGIIMLFLGASGVTDDLQRTLNQVWKTQEKTGFFVLLREKILSISMVLGIGFFLLVSLMISTALTIMGRYFGYLLPMPEWILQSLNALISFFVITFLFSAIFKLLPNSPISWKDALVGSAVTSFLFMVGKSILGLYLGKAITGSSYGAAGSVMVMLLWFYYSSQILYFGAELTKTYSEQRGSIKNANSPSSH